MMADVKRGLVVCGILACSEFDVPYYYYHSFEQKMVEGNLKF